MRGRRGQEEFVGFGLIIIVVAIVLLIFLGFTLRKDSSPELVESYEVESFIQTILQHTTDCEDNREFLPVQKLIFDCNEGGSCEDGRNFCTVLEGTIKELTEESWNVGEEGLTRGYEFEILREGGEILKIEEGNKTNSYKGSKQHFSKGGNSIEIYFTAYY